MSRREDHEHVVSAAREDMGRFDGRQALERWLQNFVAPGLTIGPQQWCTVVKAAGRGWAVEIGTEDDGPTPPPETYRSDPGAPAPPVMEIRPPKPEPVPHRFNVPSPFPVPSTEELIAAGSPLDDLRRITDRKIMEAMLLPAGMLTANDGTATGQRLQTLTMEKLERSIRDAMGWGFADRRAEVRLGYNPIGTSWLQHSYGMGVMRSESVVIGYDPGGEDHPVAKRPPPTSSARNK